MTEIRHAAALPGYLVDRHRAWHETAFARDRAWYARLAVSGQHPRTMLISCCDSRVAVVQMFGAEPGDLFVVRNVANLVPPYEPDHNHHGTSAAVEFAVEGLRIAHIVVVGHSDCGGVSACRRMCAGEPGAHAPNDSFVARWTDILRPGYDRVARTAPPDPQTFQTALEQEAVLTSLRNLETFPFVARACAEGVLTLHGCWFDIATGTLKVYDPQAGIFA